ncbi:MAG: PD-(D/E)XK nuclease family protein [Thermoplasmata archaeon]|nr:PD-(D/E)XK nuclease family protein [Thermoplasmata archaeon]MCI4359127.1 PD-(D/E)XK nuclease family protein [Thermoplasmata archaeon]
MAASEPLLSYSSVRAYLECPLRWKFLYVDGLKEAPRGYFSFGRTVHNALEELLRPLVRPAAEPEVALAQTTLDGWAPRSIGREPDGGLMPLDDLLALYRRSWISDGYANPEEEERYRVLGSEILRSYYQTLELSPPHPVAIERHLEATWNGLRVHGYVDRIDRTAHGGLEIVDYKTSRELSQDDARESDQLGIYQVLVERNFTEPVEALTLYHLRFLRPLTVPPRPAKEIGALYERVGTARDGIRSQAFEPTPGRQCSRCDFRAICPEFRDVPDEERQPLADLVDRFARLREEEQRVDGELRATAEELHAAAQRLGVHRIPGSQGFVRRKPEESWQYPPEGVRALLEETGLSERADPIDPTSVRRLQRDPTVPPEVRQRLAAVGHRQVRWYWEIDPQKPTGD